MEFPRLVYRSANNHKPVQNADEHAAALADGWYDSVPDAIAKKHTPPPAGNTPEPTKAKPPVPADVQAVLDDLKAKAVGGDVKALQEYAKGIGVKVPAKADAAALYEIIEKALTTPAG